VLIVNSRHHLFLIEEVNIYSHPVGAGVGTAVEGAVAGGMVGFRAVKSGFSGKSFAERNFCLKLSSMPPVYPPYKSGVKKK